MKALRRIQEARSLYVDALRAALVEAPNSHIEPALRNANGDLVTEGVLSLPYRADLIERQDGTTIMVDSPERISFPPLEEQVGEVIVTLKPLIWDYVSFKLTGQHDAVSLEEFRVWFMRWFDPDDTNLESTEGFLGVVHFASDPKLSKAHTELIVDFGSAPIEAFEECIKALVSTGTTRVVVA